MKNLKVFFTLIVMVMFVMTSCSKEENPVTDLQFEKVVVVDESEMIPSSEFYDNYEENIKEFIENLQNTDEVTDRVACPEINPLTQNSIVYIGSCGTELIAETRRDVGQMIRIIHYTRETGVQGDSIYNTGNDDCSLQILSFPIPTTIPSGQMKTYIAILDANGNILVRDYEVWTNC